MARIGGAVGTSIGSVTLRAANRFNPILSGPSAPLKTSAMLDSFGPSLMPRSSVHQGMAAGLSVLAAEAVGLGVNAVVRRLAPDDSPVAWKLMARAGVAAAGFAVSKLPETDDESTQIAAARSAGELAMWGALGGMVFEGGIALRERYPARGAVRPILLGLGGFGLALYRSRKLMQDRQNLIDRWTEDDKPASLPMSIAIGSAVTIAGRGAGRAFLASRRGAIEFFGTDPAHAFFGRAINGAVWGAGAIAAYTAGVSYIARSNEKIEPAYSSPPANEYVSGGPNSISPFEELGLQGRRYVTDIMTPDLIEATMGEKALHPIRAYIGFNSEPIYSSGRAEMALDELERLGGFDRKYLLLVSPTGTGWVDQTMIESAEFLARGDIATVCIQYGRSPSFLALQKVQLGAAQFRQLLWGVKQRLADRDPAKKPTVVVFGESLGAWSSSDTVMHQGIKGFDHYGIDRALWFGLPGLAKWSKTGMREGSSDLVPPGTVGAFDNPDQLAELSPEERDKLRAVVLDHDNDPIAVVSPRLAVKRPAWLVPATKGRGVPDSMSWTPLITMVHIAIDAMNAMVTVPGEFKSFGHDYREDTTRMVHMAYHLPDVTEEQLNSVEDALRRLELERGERIKQGKEESAEQGEERTKGAKWLRDRGPEDQDRPAEPATPGEARGDIQ